MDILHLDEPPLLGQCAAPESDLGFFNISRKAGKNSGRFITDHRTYFSGVIYYCIGYYMPCM